MVYIRAEVEVRPTEDEFKVRQALKNVIEFDTIRSIEVRKGYRVLIAESRNINALAKIYELARRQRILDTLRNVLMKRAREGAIVIKLNKQAAYQGVLSLVDTDDESQLGAITITIVSDKLDEIIDWLAPRTSRGRPIWEREAPRDA